MSRPHRRPGAWPDVIRRPRERPPAGAGPAASAGGPSCVRPPTRAGRPASDRLRGQNRPNLLLGLSQMLMGGAVAVVRQGHPLAWGALAGAGPTLQRIAVGIETVLGQPAQKLIGQLEIQLDDPEHPLLGRHGEVRPDIAEQRPRGMGEVTAIRRQTLDGRLAGAQNALVVDVGTGGVGVLHDFAGQLAVDRAAKPVHADLKLLSNPSRGHNPGESRRSIPPACEAHEALRINCGLTRKLAYRVKRAWADLS